MKIQSNSKKHLDLKNAKDFVINNEERLELAINATGAGIWDWNVLTDELTFNPRWAEIIGYTLEELLPIDFDSWSGIVHPEDMLLAQSRLKAHWRGELNLYKVEMRIKHKHGQYVWVLVSGSTVEWQLDGRAKRMIGTHIDISERKARELDLIIASQLLRESQKVAKVGGWELNLETGVLYWTDETYRLYDTTPEAFDPTVDAGIEYYLPNCRDVLSQALHLAIEKGTGYDLELQTLTTTGRLIDVRTTCIVTQENNISTRLTGIFQDISDQKAIQRKLELSNSNLEEANGALQLAAHYDVLTELPNRILLADRMQQAMNKSLRHKQSVAIGFIDLDGFKDINDTYGHSVGDQFLRKIGNKLKFSLRECDTLARTGGDEFVVVLDELNDNRDSLPILTRLLEAASTDVVINGKLLRVSASIGVTFFPENNISPDQLLRCADQAMYKAKQLGKNRFHIFDFEKDVAVKHRQEELERLRVALKNEEFVLFYQPKIDLRNKKVIGVEALIRWNHPELGILPPGVFLPIIDQDLLGLEVGEWVIKSALKQLCAWKNTEMDMPISVNISPKQLQHPDFILHLQEMLKEHPLPAPYCLEFEILESSALKDIDLVSNVINKCNQLGIVFSIDDFGTGYSSLTYLKRLPAKCLKIDQSFVIDMLTDNDNQTIIQGIIELSKAFGLKVIAEGVETPEHGTTLALLGCFLAQGYGIAKPMPVNEFPDWLTRWYDKPELIDGSV